MDLPKLRRRTRKLTKTEKHNKKTVVVFECPVSSLHKRRLICTTLLCSFFWNRAFAKGRFIPKPTAFLDSCAHVCKNSRFILTLVMMQIASHHPNPRESVCSHE